MVYLFKLSIGQSVDIPLADLVSMFIEKKVQLAAGGLNCMYTK